MATSAIAVIGHRFGNPSGAGLASHVYTIAAWIDCPPIVKPRLPLQVQIGLHQFISRSDTAVPGATQAERDAVNNGDVIEFVIDEAGGQHGDQLTADELSAALMEVHARFVAAVAAKAVEYSDPKAVLFGKRIGPDGKIAGLAAPEKDAINTKALAGKALHAEADAADLAANAKLAEDRAAFAAQQVIDATADGVRGALLARLEAEAQTSAARAASIADDAEAAQQRAVDAREAAGPKGAMGVSVGR